MNTAGSTRHARPQRGERLRPCVQRGLRPGDGSVAEPMLACMGAREPKHGLTGQQIGADRAVVGAVALHPRQVLTDGAIAVPQLPPVAHDRRERTRRRRRSPHRHGDAHRGEGARPCAEARLGGYEEPRLIDAELRGVPARKPDGVLPRECRDLVAPSRRARLTMTNHPRPVRPDGALALALVAPGLDDLAEEIVARADRGVWWRWSLAPHLHQDARDGGKDLSMLCRDVVRSGELRPIAVRAAHAQRPGHPSGLDSDSRGIIAPSG